MRKSATTTRATFGSNGPFQCPDLALRSIFIVGFPGETAAEFDELLEEAQLDRVGCFKCSPVDGAAANALPDQVPEELKEERYARFMVRAARMSAERLARRVGRRLRVLVDAVDAVDAVGADGALGRTEADEPQIDVVVRMADAP